MHMTPESLLSYALGYAKHDLRVFPLHSIHSGDCSCGRDNCSAAGKHPRTKNGVKDATTNREQIMHWWASWPEANIGIATGNGLYVIDIDCIKGGTLESLNELGITGFTWTRTATTGSGGFHLYLKCSQPLGNTASKLAPFVDTRGEGGYVVAPPSRNSKGPYGWFHKGELQEVPEQMLARLRGPASLAAIPAQASASASLANEARNNYLISMAGRLRGHGLNAAEICSMLLTLNEQRYGEGRHPQGPLSLDEMERTIFKSIAKWEQECGKLQAICPSWSNWPN